MESINRIRNNDFNDSLDDTASTDTYVASGRNNDKSTADASTADAAITNTPTLIFDSFCLKNSYKKTIRIDLYNSTVIQSTDRYSNKRWKCNTILHVHSVDHTVELHTKKSIISSINVKKLQFASTDIASTFARYINACNDIGDRLKSYYDRIVAKHSNNLTQVITRDKLIIALDSMDINYSVDDISFMLRRASHIDYITFFEMFIGSNLSTYNECLQHWLTMSKNDTNASIGNTRMNVKLLLGERRFQTIDRVTWSMNHYANSSNNSDNMYDDIHTYKGNMLITNYRIILCRSLLVTDNKHVHTRYSTPSYFNCITLPLSTIYSIEQQQQQQQYNCNIITIISKDYRSINISHRYNSSNIITSIKQCKQDTLFAYTYKATFTYNGWELRDIRSEYKRLGLLDDSVWKMVDNHDWTFSATYPQYVLVPSAMSDAEVVAAAGYRSRRRLPVITYKARKTNAVLARSAQPVAGITNKRSTADALLLNYYRTKGSTVSKDSDTHKLYILDARRKIAATLNQAAGKGTEDVKRYVNTETIFCNIDNIHVMRQSASMLSDLTYTYTANSEHHDHMNVSLCYHTKLEECGWLKYLRLIMIAGVVGAEKLLLESSSVLVHCSDGWDRTAQICCVIQILIDPYYRTIVGLATLIEKEWSSFGHMYTSRYGSECDDVKQHSHEKSPVFLQFLDVLNHIMIQFPTSFEYNEQLLIFLADHLHSSLFGTFLGNCDRERVQDLNVVEKTVSIWSYIVTYSQSFGNRSYVLYDRPIWPCTTSNRFHVWERYFSRFSSIHHPNCLSGEVWEDDWGCR